MMIAVVIAAHNPQQDRLSRVFDALECQTLSRDAWSVVLVDNASTNLLNVEGTKLALGIVRENRLGLTWARLRGVLESNASLIVFVDDDNVLAPEYLATALRIADENSSLGAFGGKCYPIWETGEAPTAWVKEFENNFALRNFGDQSIIQAWCVGDRYPSAAPVGAGMVVRREALNGWIETLKTGVSISDRSGTSLSSGGDNDIVMHIVRAGFKVGYFPDLSLGHIIPESRLSQKYLARLNRGIARSWVEVLEMHGINPWPPAAPWTVLLRKARAYLWHRAWAGPSEFVRWSGACGNFEGRAAIWRRRRLPKRSDCNAWLPVSTASRAKRARPRIGRGQ